VSRVLLFFVLVPLVLVGALSPAAAASDYRPPVDAPVVDGFRLPLGPYGPGNRGLEYATEPGQEVRAIGSGLVVFAGPVAGNRAVTVLHPDGLRSSYSYLDEVLVKAGERVSTGTPVGTAGERFHLGVRTGGTYLDPAALFATGHVRLVPLPDPISAVPADPATGAVPDRPPDRPEALPERAWGWLTGAGRLAARS
jgi:murein DD-endopeptidase MepM/ murein hydrolase activator NlpD